MASRLTFVIKPFSVSQILITSSFIIALPALWLSFVTIGSLEDELELHIEYVETGEISKFPEKQKLFIEVGRFLRFNNFPFTDKEPLKIDSVNTNLLVWTEKLRDAKSAIIYSWGLLFFIGFSTYLIVGILINRSFQKFSADIDTLKPHQKNQAISIEGPTDLRGLSENLESLRLQLDEDDQQQKAFLQHISHEIKTPLTSIKEGATLLNEEVIGSMTPDQKEVTQILVKSSKELQNAIENLLNYNSMVSSKGQPNRAPIELSSLTKEALGKHELIIKQKQLTLKLEIEEIVAFIDRQKIITVFDNLISNAIKHAPINGQVHIWLQKKKGDKARFIIKDNGPGIIKSQEKAIFDPFFVGKSAGFSTLKGTGLGLSIAKQYVNEHHGDIKLINCHSGAKFQVSFPINS